MGSAAITGGFTPEEATDLKIVLEAGALPAPLEIVEERTVGPSLGIDSIKSGVRAALIGGIAVAIFMVLYYNLSGLLAVLALVLNLVIIMAVLGGLRGTLTLPGIAGIILTIGMAVDANVLIFERIREELALEKTVRRAIKDGYSRALVAILDANITTIITAFVLFQFGTGPIRGFAITLIIGILASMFTAIVVTRTIYDAITGTRRLAKLSI
jgi:preprotein translocase subunit SecD